MSPADLVKINASPEAAISHTSEQVALIKRHIAKDATDDELQMFLHHCKRMALDPLSKQIYFQKRGGKAVYITAIDGFRLIAGRTGEHAGTDDTVFDNEENPQKASVTVYRVVKGVRYPFTATARWEEYCPPQGNDHMWNKMPCTMLGKCAEALALRKAFPSELGGVYVKEEMDQASSDLGIRPIQPTAEDGNIEPTHYTIPFGKFKQRTLEEVGADELRGYVEYLESKAKKDGKQITGMVGDFIKNAEDFIGSFENLKEEK